MKKKILLLSDDLRMTSGIATVSKEIVLGTVHKYDWVQLGAAINHPEIGKIVDMGVTSCTVSNGMGYFSCTFEQISSFEGKVPFLIENIRIRKK